MVTLFFRISERLKTSAYLILPLCFFSLMANPQKGDVEKGTVSFFEEQNRLTITQTSEKSIINWKGFSIGQGEVTEFIQPDASSTVLNRVSSFEKSVIDGVLKANGQVFLVNPQGVIVSKNGSISTKGFLATTLNIKTDGFLSGNSFSLSGESDKKIENFGMIEAIEGNVFLIAREVKNVGTITAKDTAGLVGAQEVFLISEGEKALVKMPTTGTVCNEGIIKAAQVELKAAGGNTYSFAVSNSGVIETKGMTNEEGRIYLKGETNKTLVEGDLSASTLSGNGGVIHILGEKIFLSNEARIDSSGEFDGGTVLVGGDYQGKNSLISNAKILQVEEGVSIYSSATVKGDGGKAIFWADDAIAFFGAVKAEGIGEEHTGGFVEVSSKGSWAYSGNVSTMCPGGKTGTLLFDPYNITISGAVSNNMNLAFGVYTATANPGTLNATVLANDLLLSNIIVTTASGGAFTGLLLVQAPISWASTNSLHLLADGVCQINSSITMGGDLKLESLTDRVTMASTISCSGPYKLTITTPKQVGITGNITHTYAGAGLPVAVDITGQTVPGTQNGVQISGGNISVTNGDVNIVGTAYANNTNQAGVNVFNGGGIISNGIGANAGNINLTGNSTTGATGSVSGIYVQGVVSTMDGNILFNGTSSAPGFSGKGIRVSSTGSISSTGLGTITFNGAVTGTSGLGFAVELNGASASVSTVSSNIIVNGTATGGVTSGSTRGVVIQNVTGNAFSSTSGDITIIGAGNGLGIDLDDGDITSVSGDVDLKGTITAGIYGLYIRTNGTVGSGSMTGDIYLQADTISIEGSVQGTGASDLYLLPTTPGSSIGIGTLSTGTYQLTDTSVSNLVAGFNSINLGINGTGTHLIDVNPSIATITFNDSLNVFGQNVTVASGKTLSAPDETFNIGQSGAVSFTLDGTVTPTVGTFTVNGGAGDDTFSIPNVSQAVTINGAGGTGNKLIGSNTTKTWSIIPADQGTVSSITFSNIQSLDGGSGADTFSFGDTIGMSGAINGVSGTNTLDYSSYTATTVIVNYFGGTATNVTGGVSNLQNVVAGQVGNTLTGAIGVNNQFEFPTTPTTSTVTGNSSAAAGNTIFMNLAASNAFSIAGADDAGSINGLTPNPITFTGIGNLIGGSVNDTFDFVGALALTGTTGIDGGSAGSNSFTGPAVNTTFTPNASVDDQGDLLPTGASQPTLYQNIESIAGGSSLDTIDYSAFGSPVTVDLSSNSAFRYTGTVTLIDKLIAGTSTNSLKGVNGTDTLFEFQTTPAASLVMGGTVGGAFGNQIIMNNAANNSYQITGNDGGTINSVIIFTDVGRLLGSSLTDTFNFSGLWQLTGTTAIDGGSGGINQIVGPAAAYSIFTISTTNNAGTIYPNGTLPGPGTTSYQNIKSLSSLQTFSLLDYSSHGTAVSVDFTSGSATNVDSGAAVRISGIRRVRAGTGTNSLIGIDSTINYFYFPSHSPGASTVVGKTSTGSGNFLIMEAIAPPNFFTITGSDDAGNVNGAGVIAFSQIGNLTGGAGIDTFTFSGARRLTGSFGVDGGALGINTIIGPNVATTFTPDTGLVDEGDLLPTGALGPTHYLNIDSITGGSMIDTIDYSAFGIPVTVDLSANTADRYTGTVTSIERLIAGTNTNALTGKVGVDNFFEFQTSPGISMVTANSPATAVGNQLYMNVMSLNTYQITSLNGGTITTVTNPITFSNIGNLKGGMNGDQFTLAVGGRISGVPNGIQGGGGTSNTITGPDEVATWTVLSDNSGDITPTTVGKTIFSDVQSWTGGNVVDTINFSGAYRVQNGINGGGGDSFVKGPDVVNAWSIIGSTTITLTPTGASGSTTLTSVNHIVGGSMVDDFTFSNAAKLDGLPNAIDGGTGSGNTITGPSVPTVWNISTADNQGSINTNALGATTIIRVQKWTGGAALDDFIFNGALRIDDGIDGGGGTNSITGPDFDTDWTISSNAGGVMDTTAASGTTALTSIHSWIGGTGVDTFEFTGAFRLSASVGIDGGGGNNIIKGPNVATTWDIIDDDEGTLLPTGAPAPGTTYFKNIPNLTGGASTSDYFTLQDQKGLTGQVSGGGTGAQNTLDYSNYLTSVTIVLPPVPPPLISGTATNILGGILYFGNAAAGSGSMTGGGGDDVFHITSSTGSITVDGLGGTNTIIGPDGGVAWTVDGSLTSDYSGFIDSLNITFDNIQKIIGGGGVDTFTMKSTGLMDLIDGTSGGDTIQAKDQDNTWNITDNNAGNFPSVISFVNIPNATGGSMSDIFVIDDQKGMAGLVDGGSAEDNILDYSAYTTPVEVNIAAGTATNMGAIINFQDAIVPDIATASQEDRRILNTQLFTTLFYDKYEHLGNYTLEMKLMKRTIKPYYHMYWYKIADLKVRERK